ncbi:hypothetical protein BJX68DRAFT_163193 [Aspergillus pseudodeflectus]|uniref:DNA2/NAM7 helicase-like C-terminal domain-containing protein n=1 Tax=Aspergillus pseudodeflectus TaxID=176178 RepID=A0ABR4L281_9EURO
MAPLAAVLCSTAHSSHAYMDLSSVQTSCSILRLTMSLSEQQAWSMSAFERLLKKGYASTLLNIQYRAHDLIYKPTSTVFYHGQVQSYREFSIGVSVVEYGRLIIRFLDVRGQTTYDEANCIINEKECNAAIDLAVQLLKQASRSRGSEPRVLRTSMYFVPWLRFDHYTYPIYDGLLCSPHVYSEHPSQSGFCQRNEGASGGLSGLRTPLT